MSPGARMEYLESIVVRYRKSSKKQKTVILNEFCQTCGYNRKYAIYLLYTFKRFTKSKSKKRGKPSKYNHPKYYNAIAPNMVSSLYAMFKTP